LPIVKPNQGRGRKYYRRKGRKIFNNSDKARTKVRRRVFGALTNWLG
jgi:hypothetical protein